MRTFGDTDIPLGHDEVAIPFIFVPDGHAGPRPGYPWFEAGRMTLGVEPSASEQQEGPLGPRSRPAPASARSGVAREITAAGKLVDVPSDVASPPIPALDWADEAMRKAIHLLQSWTSIAIPSAAAQEEPPEESFPRRGGTGEEMTEEEAAIRLWNFNRATRELRSLEPDNPQLTSLSSGGVPSREWITRLEVEVYAARARAELRFRSLLS